jgi:murein DD-endopeptidase MepM/ murein hydrolase activator NlpD
VLERLAAILASLALAVPAPTSAEGPVDRAFPVRGATDYARAHHDYPATDVFAACGRKAVAPVDGVVLELSRKDRWDPATNRGARRGGKFVSIRGRDGVRYYLSHFSGVRKVLRPGTKVRAGQHIAWVGHTGSARGTACHVHVGLSPVCRRTGDWRVRRGVVRPYRFLRSWESGGNRSPAGAVAAWKREHGCP